MRSTHYLEEQAFAAEASDSYCAKHLFGAVANRLGHDEAHKRRSVPGSSSSTYIPSNKAAELGHKGWAPKVVAQTPIARATTDRRYKFDSIVRITFASGYPRIYVNRDKGKSKGKTMMWQIEAADFDLTCDALPAYFARIGASEELSPGQPARQPLPLAAAVPSSSPLFACGAEAEPVAAEQADLRSRTHLAVLLQQLAAQRQPAQWQHIAELQQRLSTALQELASVRAQLDVDDEAVPDAAEQQAAALAPRQQLAAQQQIAELQQRISTVLRDLAAAQAQLATSHERDAGAPSSKSVSSASHCRSLQSICDDAGAGAEAGSAAAALAQLRLEKASRPNSRTRYASARSSRMSWTARGSGRRAGLGPQAATRGPRRVIKCTHRRFRSRTLPRCRQRAARRRG